jgi:hypothetical protein
MAWLAFNLAFLAIAKPHVKYLLGTSVQEPKEIQEFYETITLHLLSPKVSTYSTTVQPCSLKPLLDIPHLICLVIVISIIQREATNPF